eukprot:562643_1
MSHRVKAWLSSIRRAHSSSSCVDNQHTFCPFDDTPTDIIQYILSFLDHHELHRIRLIGKQWNNLCDIQQKILHLSPQTPTEDLKYWMLKLRNIHHVNLSNNKHVDNRFLIWLKKEYFPLKIKQKLTKSLSTFHKHICMGFTNDYNVQLNIHIDISFCFGIDCVEENSSLCGTQRAVNGHNDYLKKLINYCAPYGCTFNIFGNYRIINPCLTLDPKHVVLLQLHALKYNEIQHCFKFASPVNRQFTGPIQRFENLIKNGYPIMIEWDHCRVIPLLSMCPDEEEFIDDLLLPIKKHFIVEISKKNKHERFKWTLSRQMIEPYHHYWMTDSVCSLYTH